MKTWLAAHHEIALTGMGAQAFLALPMTAFFASRQCPGIAIRAAMDWALQQAKARNVVVEGFHSPLEQSVLKVLIAASSPAVVVLARPVQGAKLPAEWHVALEKGHLAVVSGVMAVADRLTQQLAIQRNELVAKLSERIVVAHASPGGSLATQLECWRQEGQAVQVLGNPG